MKSQKQIFILFSCDEWKSKDDMRVICATTSANKIKNAIITKLKHDEIAYNEDEDLNVNNQINMFKKDWKDKTREFINDRLKFAFYDYVYDGEIQ